MIWHWIGYKSLSKPMITISTNVSMYHEVSMNPTIYKTGSLFPQYLFNFITAIVVIIILHPCGAKSILVNINICFLFNHFSTLQSFMLLKFWIVEYKHLCILHIQYYGYWWPGDIRSQGIGNHGINLVFQEYSTFTTRGVKKSLVYMIL